MLLTYLTEVINYLLIEYKIKIRFEVVVSVPKVTRQPLIVDLYTSEISGKF